MNTCSGALYNLGSGSWLTWANDTAAHYAAIHCPRWRTIGPAVQHANISYHQLEPYLSHYLHCNVYYEATFCIHYIDITCNNGWPALMGMYLSGHPPMSLCYCVAGLVVLLWLNKLSLSSDLCYASILVDTNCSFLYGGLYYSCIENMTDVSTDEQPLACLNVITSRI